MIVQRIRRKNCSKNGGQQTDGWTNRGMNLHPVISENFGMTQQIMAHRIMRAGDRFTTPRPPLGTPSPPWNYFEKFALSSPKLGGLWRMFGSINSRVIVMKYFRHSCWSRLTWENKFLQSFLFARKPCWTGRVKLDVWIRAKKEAMTEVQSLTKVSYKTVLVECWSNIFKCHNFKKYQFLSTFIYQRLFFWMSKIYFSNCVNFMLLS